MSIKALPAWKGLIACVGPFGKGKKIVRDGVTSLQLPAPRARCRHFPLHIDSPSTNDFNRPVPPPYCRACPGSFDVTPVGAEGDLQFAKGVQIGLAMPT